MPYKSVSFEYAVQTGERRVRVKTISEEGSNFRCSEEERKMMWMRETRINIFTQMELEACRNELGWLIKCYLCAVNDYPGRVLSTDAFASPPRLPYKFGKGDGNGSERHLVAYSKDDSKKVLPATSMPVASSTTSRNSIVLIIPAMH